MLNHTPRVEVIGAGMGGLTAAIALTRIAGVHVTVFEQASKLGEVGAGVTVAPNGQRVYDKLGLLDEIKRAGATPEAHGVYLAANGTLIAEAAWEDTARKYQNVGMYRPDLIDILARAVPADSLHLGHKLASIQESDSNVRLEF